MAYKTGRTKSFVNSRSKAALCIEILQVSHLAVFKDLGLRWAPSYSFMLEVKYGVQVDKNQDDTSRLRRRHTGNIIKFLLLRSLWSLEIWRYALTLRVPKWTNKPENSPFLNYLLFHSVKMSSSYRITLQKIIQRRVSNYIQT